MTANQLQYWRNVETERANKASEGIKQQEADIKQKQLDLNEWVEQYQKWIRVDHQENEYIQAIASLVQAIIGKNGVQGFAGSIMGDISGIFS